MLSVLRKTKELNLPIDMQLHMFYCMVVPILLYGSEIYGYEKSDIIESLFLQFYKIIMSFKKGTPNAILYGELGRYTADILIKSRMIGFWKKNRETKFHVFFIIICTKCIHEISTFQNG